MLLKTIKNSLCHLFCLFLPMTSLEQTSGYFSITLTCAQQTADYSLSRM